MEGGRAPIGEVGRGNESAGGVALVGYWLGICSLKMVRRKGNVPLSGGAGNRHYPQGYLNLSFGYDYEARQLFSSLNFEFLFYFFGTPLEKSTRCNYVLRIDEIHFSGSQRLTANTAKMRLTTWCWISLLRKSQTLCLSRNALGRSLV